MKKLISKFTILLGVAVLSLASCKKDPNADVVLPGPGLTTFELAKGVAVASNGATATSNVTVNAIVGEKLATNKVIAKIEINVLKGTTSSSSRTLIKTFENVTLAPAVTSSLEVSSIGAYGNSENIVWGLKFILPLKDFGTGLTNPQTGRTTGSTSLIITLKDAAGKVISEYTSATSEYSLKLLAS